MYNQRRNPRPSKRRKHTTPLIGTVFRQPNLVNGVRLPKAETNISQNIEANFTVLCFHDWDPPSRLPSICTIMDAFPKACIPSGSSSLSTLHRAQDQSATIQSIEEDASRATPNSAGMTVSRLCTHRNPTAGHLLFQDNFLVQPRMAPNYPACHPQTQGHPAISLAETVRDV